MSKTALLLIDFQNDYFQDGKWPLVGIEAAAEQGAKLLIAFREKGLPVIHIRHEFTTDKAPFFLPGSVGAQHHVTVKPANDEHIVLKHHINSFRETNLQTILQKEGVETVMIAGAMSDMCVDAVTRAANDYGYQCVVAHDACATKDTIFKGVTVPAHQVHASFLAALEFGYAKVDSTEALLDKSKVFWI